MSAPAAQAAQGRAVEGPEVPPASSGREDAHHYKTQVLIATFLVVVCPTLLVWWLRRSGVVTSYAAGAGLGVAASLAAAHLGRAFWQQRPGSQHLLFNELLVWGYVRRRYRERQLGSARRLLGSTNNAQARLADGLSRERQVKLLEQLAGTLDACDPNTHGHSQRVARYAWIIASRMKLPHEQVDLVRVAAAMHDIGKIHTPVSVLRKPGKLTDEEYDVMKRHAAEGAEMATVLNDAALKAIVRHHHERLDGSGYPDGLAGEAIPIGARIIAVADTFDAITATRPYRRGRTHKEGLDILEAEAGTKLDEDAVRAFCGHYKGRREVAFWTSLTTLPERVLAQISSSFTTVASAAKIAAVAAIVGNAAAGAAHLAAPRTPTRPATGAAAARPFAPASSTLGTPAGAVSVTQAGAGAHAGALARAGQRAHPSLARGSHGGAAAGSGATSPAGSPSVAGSSSTGSTGTSAPAGHDGGSPGRRSERGGEGGGAGTGGEAKGGGTATGGGSSSTGGGTGSSGSGGGGSSGGSGSGGGKAKSEETARKPVEEVKSKVEETVKKPVEEVKSKVEETVKKPVEEVKSKVEETVKKPVEEVKGKVEETIKQPVEKVLGKL